MGMRLELSAKKLCEMAMRKCLRLRCQNTKPKLGHVKQPKFTDWWLLSLWWRCRMRVGVWLHQHSI